VASRRAAERLILDGRVRVNGKIVRELGARADPERDSIRVDEKRVSLSAPRSSYVVYKPRGVVTTTRDPEGRRTVLDLLPAAARRLGLFPVGRLDAASEGVLLLTNDGELAHALLHPSFEVPRSYRVSIDGSLAPEELRELEQGISVAGRRVAPTALAVLREESGRSVLELTLHEGRKHEIREMLAAVGHRVRRLVRIRFGPLASRGLRAGEWRRLTTAESQALARIAAAAEDSGARTPPAAGRQPRGTRARASGRSRKNQ
jgi:pseudouridine synthase